MLCITPYIFLQAKCFAVQLHFIVACFRKNSDGLDLFLTQTEAFGELFQQIICPLKWILSTVLGLSFIFPHDISDIKKCMY